MSEGAVDDRLTGGQKKAIRNYVAGWGAGYLLLLGLGAWGLSQMATGRARDVAVAEVQSQREHFSEYRRQFREEIQALAAETRRALGAESVRIMSAVTLARGLARDAETMADQVSPRIKQLKGALEVQIADVQRANGEKLRELQAERFKSWKRNHDSLMNALTLVDAESATRAADISALFSFFNLKASFVLVTLRNDQSPEWREEKVGLLNELADDVREARKIHSVREASFGNLLNDMMIYKQRLRQPGMDAQTEVKRGPAR